MSTPPQKTTIRSFMQNSKFQAMDVTKIGELLRFYKSIRASRASSTRSKSVWESKPVTQSSAQILLIKLSTEMTKSEWKSKSVKEQKWPNKLIEAWWCSRMRRGHCPELAVSIHCRRSKSYMEFLKHAVSFSDVSTSLSRNAMEPTSLECSE